MTKELAEHAATWLSTLINTLDSIKEDHAELERLRDQVDGMLRYASMKSLICLLTHTCRVLTIIQEWMALRTRQRLLQRTWNKSEDSEELVRLRERLHDAFERFMVRYFVYVGESLHLTRYATVACIANPGSALSSTNSALSSTYSE